MRPEVHVVGARSAALDRLAATSRVEAAEPDAGVAGFRHGATRRIRRLHGFPVIASVPLDWDVTHIFWVDERAVPAESPDSNFGLAGFPGSKPARRVLPPITGCPPIDPI